MLGRVLLLGVLAYSGVRVYLHWWGKKLGA
jgi:hypothetical protein